MVCASWTGLFSHIGFACQMTRATSINDNLINKRDSFDDSQVLKAETDIILGQNSGPALAARRTSDDCLEVGDIERQSMYANNTS